MAAFRMLIVQAEMVHSKSNDSTASKPYICNEIFSEDIKTLIFDLVLFSIHVCQIKDLTASTQWSVTYETHYNILFFKSPTILPHLGKSFLLTYVLLLQLCLLSLSSFSTIV